MYDLGIHFSSLSLLNINQQESQKATGTHFKYLTIWGNSLWEENCPCLCGRESNVNKTHENELGNLKLDLLSETKDTEKTMDTEEKCRPSTNNFLQLYLILGEVKYSCTGHLKFFSGFSVNELLSV